MHDLIIVGAGTAGCVLAERLTASRRLRVLLIEAGGPPANRFVRIPAAFPRLFRSEVDWAFESEPQTAVGGRRIFTPRGKMLGGSSNMNAQVHQWCHPADFEGWEAAGASGWGWADVAPVFKSQEYCAPDMGDESRGRSGPMHVDFNRNARPLSNAFVAAARSTGFGDQSTYNGRAYRGAWLAEIAHNAGKRFSAYDAYLKPSLGRSNLEVLSSAQVTGITVEDGHARGVTVQRDGATDSVDAGGVVLAAGAFGSPQLLMLSGIGPAAELAELGIPVVHDMPEVGANLQDHPVLGTVFSTRSKNTLKRAESLPSLLGFIALGRGMLASNAIEAIAFTQINAGREAGPDLEIIFLPLEYRPDLLEPPRVHAFSLGSAVVAPRSRGRLFLRSADPLSAPAIDFNLLGDPDGIDASVLCAGIRLCRRIASTAPLSDYNTGELRPGSGLETDEDLLAHAGNEIQTVYHPTSTCRMGSDAQAVVDPRLRCRGFENLWVADASVMPSVPRGHPNAVVAMIAHRAADWIETALAR